MSHSHSLYCILLVRMFYICIYVPKSQTLYSCNCIIHFHDIRLMICWNWTSLWLFYLLLIPICQIIQPIFYTEFNFSPDEGVMKLWIVGVRVNLMVSVQLQNEPEIFGEVSNGDMRNIYTSLYRKGCSGLSLLNRILHMAHITIIRDVASQRSKLVLITKK